jgi:ubiquinone/menaquinone biosynthesis C-methylase UbiE
VNTNINTYSSPEVIRHYAEYSKKLQLPEKAIFEVLDPGLSRMKMIDIGVGGGRTTAFFAPRVKEYLGVDFAEGMINICNKKFKTVFPSAKFEVGDVRNLSNYTTGYFDLVLFSFNGLDNINHQERALALKEIKRICAAQGYFCFSSHNIQNLPGFFKIRYRWHPVKFLRSLIRRKRLINQNIEAIKKMDTADYVNIYDDVYDFGLHTYYVRPSYQIAQLNNLGFRQVQLFDLTTGRMLTESSEYNATTDPWIYYLCH